MGVLILFGAVPTAEAGLERPRTYTLVGRSSLVDACPICGRPEILRPIRGTFALRLVEENAILRRFAVEALQFETTDGLYRGSGAGTFALRLVGPAEFQDWDLAVEIGSPDATTACAIAEADPASRMAFPMVGVGLVQTDGTLTREFRLVFEAAPFVEMWFSTAHGMTPGGGGGYLDAGTLLSSGGRIVRKGGELLEGFGVEPGSVFAGLDAIDVLPGGRVVFSIGEDIKESSAGPLRHGDLLDESGTVVATPERLLGPFAFQPPVPDLGLDAVQVLGDGTTVFSIEREAFSESLGVMIGPGDLLSDAGGIVRGHRELLSRFQPEPGAGDVGLDAVWVWDHGEIWFSVEKAFNDAVLGLILPGDLLSDQGIVVFRNLDLVQPFQPLEDLADFGLDALFLVVEDVAAGTAPQVRLGVESGSGDVVLEWDGDGRVFRVERAGGPGGPFETLTPLMTGRTFVDPRALRERSRAFYRVLQW